MVGKYIEKYSLIFLSIHHIGGQHEGIGWVIVRKAQSLHIESRVLTYTLPSTWKDLSESLVLTWPSSRFLSMLLFNKSDLSVIDMNVTGSEDK